MSAPAIDEARLWSDLMTLGTIGALPRGGSDRLALTDADRDARSLFAYWCAELDLSVTIDAMGNMFARREGTDPSLAPVLAGSHLDTQSPGGKFDGPLGVLGALAAVRAIAAAGIETRRPIEVVNWTNEEGARFSPGLMGSAVFAGVLPLAEAHAVVDRAGRSVGQELARIRADGPARMGGRDLDSYFELHIEQGPELEAAGITIGAVTHSHYSTYTDMECLGENAHISSMPMLRRRNALVGAARMIAEIDRIGLAYAPAGSASATVIDLWPNNRINIPHRATFSFGLVHPDAEGLAAMVAEVEAAAARITAETGLALRTLVHRQRDPIHFDANLTALVENIARDAGHSVMRMRTRPGHDAFNMTRLCPTQLIFVPCRDGLSHSELEWCTSAHATAGADVLLKATCRGRCDASVLPDTRTLANGVLMNQIDLAGRVAIVTGGSGGIGLATADRLAASGATVLVWDISETALDAAVVERPNLRTAIVDMLDEGAVSAAMADAEAKFGRIDIMVNCVGKEAPRCAVADYDVTTWQRLLAINLTATFIACKYAVQSMQRRDYGRIVNLSSTSGKDGNAFDSPYASAKAAIMGFTKSLGKELTGTNIRVNCVCPAAIDSPLFSRLPPEQKQFSIGKIPLGRLGRTSEVAALIAWLCSEECSFSTGAVFDISGGRSTY